MSKIILTGDRPTGALHLGHFVGSLQNRVKLQHSYSQFVMIADLQALTDNAENPDKVRNNVIEVALDYLAVGIDPKLTTIFVQSKITELAELTMYYLNLVTLARLQRNPTVKSEMKQKGFSADVPAGFLMYPVSQAADITAFKADTVPVGEDQLPVIEQTNEIIRKFNSIYGNVLVETNALLSTTTRLPGLNGKAKMSKSLNNGIYLSDSVDILKQKVMSMYTDPNHLKVSDPGQVKGNMVFTYLDAFDTNTNKVKELKEHYTKGGLGDMVLKKYLFQVLESFLQPIREKRATISDEQAIAVLIQGSQKARQHVQKKMKMIRQAMQLCYEYLDL